MDEQKKPITLQQLVSVLPVGADVHTFRNTMNMLIGADWRKQHLIETAEKYQDSIELTGEMARGMGHGVALHDDVGVLFIETDEELLKKLEAKL